MYDEQIYFSTNEVDRIDDKFLKDMQQISEMSASDEENTKKMRIKSII